MLLDELSKAREELANALVEAHLYAGESDMAETIYADAIEEWEEEFPQIAQRRRDAQEKARNAKEKLEATKLRTRELLENYFLQTGEKMPFGDDGGMTIQERVDWTYDDEEMIRALMTHAPFLLKIEVAKGAFRSFVNNVSTVVVGNDGDKSVVLPEYLSWMGDLMTLYLKPTTVISEKQLLADAAAEDE